MGRVKKFLLSSFLIIFISLGFSYVYLQGQNVLNSDEQIYI